MCLESQPRRNTEVPTLNVEPISPSANGYQTKAGAMRWLLFLSAAAPAVVLEFKRHKASLKVDLCSKGARLKVRMDITKKSYAEKQR